MCHVLFAKLACGEIVEVRHWPAFPSFNDLMSAVKDSPHYPRSHDYAGANATDWYLGVKLEPSKVLL